MAQESNRSLLSRTDALASRYADVLQLVGRILLGLLFLLIGWTKVTNIPGTLGYFTAMNVPFPQFWPWPAGLGEIILGLLLISGLATRYAALASFVWVLIATVIAHRWYQYPAAQQGGQYAHFTKNLAIMGGLLFVFLLGAGRISLDAMFGKKD